ncbi:hypothetical protein ACB092_04G150100 [Castanea dentata]
MRDSTSSNNKLQGKVAIITGGTSSMGEATACLFSFHGAQAIAIADVQDEKDHKLAMDGASGLGEATAHHFAAQGARAIVIADIQDENGQKVAVEIGSNICTYVHCDLRDEEQVKNLVEFTLKSYGCVDIMFSNAGMGRATQTCDQTSLDMELSAYDKLMAVNVRGMAACVKHAGKAMVEGHVRGSIVCTASHAVLGLVRCASLKLGAYGIRVNCVSPGAVGTPLLKDMFRYENEEEDKVVASNQYLKGEVMRPKNVADAVLFLASEDSEFITGHNLAVDGGCKT